MYICIQYWIRSQWWTMGCTTLRNPMKTEAYRALMTGTWGCAVWIFLADVVEIGFATCSCAWKCYLDDHSTWQKQRASIIASYCWWATRKHRFLGVLYSYFNGWTFFHHKIHFFQVFFWSQAWNADPSPRSYRYNSAVCHGSCLGCTVPWDCNKWFFSLARTINGEWYCMGFVWFCVVFPAIRGFVGFVFRKLWILCIYIYIYRRTWMRIMRMRISSQSWKPLDQMDW